MIGLSGGKKVFPEEVESVLEKSPMLQEVCVVGGIKKGGQKDGTEYVVAVVVPKQEVREQNGENTEKAVQAEVSRLSQRLANYKRPSRVIIAKNPLPRTATSKVKRKEVKAFVEKM